MTENEEETLDSENETEETENPEEVVEETTEEVEEEVEEKVDVEALQKENSTLKAQKKHWQEKAQRKPVEKKESEKSDKMELSQKDFIYIAKADIHEEDIDEVIEYANFKKLSVPEAHKALKLVLEQKTEERKTADATQTKGSPKGSVKVTGDDLIAQARKGKLPETDADWDKLSLARLDARRTKK